MSIMKIEEVDERDSSWEQFDSVFRVYIAVGAGRAITTFDISDATFGEARKWAEGNMPHDALIAIALVGRDAQGVKGLTWLFGMDPNDEPQSDLEVRMWGEMLADGASAGSI